MRDEEGKAVIPDKLARSGIHRAFKAAGFLRLPRSGFIRGSQEWRAILNMAARNEDEAGFD
jgi:hypothetical protein